MEVRGRAFGDDEDWLAYLRDTVARPDAHPELGAPAPSGLTSGLTKIEAAARGTPHAARLADAALALLERGSADERAAVQGLALHPAPDAAARLRALLERADVAGDLRARCATELLEASRGDPAGLAALREVLGGPGPYRRALAGAARFLPEWPAGWLRRAQADHGELLALWQATPVPKRRGFVDAVVALGPDHLDALIAGARHLVRVSREQAAPLMKMLAPHLPDPTSGEIVVEAMLGNLRANRKDPRQAELAERILRKHELWPKKPDPED